MSKPLALEVDNLVKIYSDGTHALKGTSFSVEQGDFFALLGPNGAGKTTTIDIITSITTKTSGTVKINGINIDKDFSQAKRSLGIVPQEPNFNFFENPLQIVTKQAGYYGISRKIALKQAQELLETLGLWDKRKTQARALSGGMKRRLMIARGLVHKPSLLILDEPTAGVDVELRRDILQFVKHINEQGTTIILTTHYLEEAEYLCRNVAILDRGVITVKSTIKDIIKALDTETFVLNLAQDIPEDFQLDGFKSLVIDHNTLEVEVKKQQDVNSLFDTLTNQGIKALSLKNKANRLEEYFVKLTTRT